MYLGLEKEKPCVKTNVHTQNILTLWLSVQVTFQMSSAYKPALFATGVPREELVRQHRHIPYSSHRQEGTVLTRGPH
jgi:hypothetical protein